MGVVVRRFKVVIRLVILQKFAGEVLQELRHLLYLPIVFTLVVVKGVPIGEQLLDCFDFTVNNLFWGFKYTGFHSS